METSPPAAVSSAPRLRRTLTLWDLILYGVIVIQPVAPMSVFGVLSDRGHGHVVTTILIAMVAMLFTAISYGKMARAYPSAGSAFTYVGQEINPALGYVTGWSMVMDYMLNPMICIIWCSQISRDFARGTPLVQSIPYWGWAVLFAAAFTWLNIQGVKTSARVNTGLAAGMGAVIVIFFLAAAHYIFGHPHNDPDFFLRPFLRSRFVEHQSSAGRNVDCSADLYRVRRDLDALRGSRKSAAQYFAGHRADLPGDWNSFGDPGLRGAVDLAGARTISKCRYCVYLCRRARVGSAVWHSWIHFIGRKFRIGHGRAVGCGAIALWHGTEQGAATILFWSGRCEETCAAEQCDFRGRDRTRWERFSSAMAWGPRC